MTPCQRFRQLIFDLFDGELDILRKKELNSHLKECSQCAQFLSKLRLLRSHLRGLTPVRTSDSFHLLLRERIRREIAGKRRITVPSFSLPTRWIPAFGLVLLVIIIGSWIMVRRTSLFKPSGSEMRVTQSSRLRGEDFHGHVDYVIDDFPNRVSVSRVDNERGTRFIDRDSLILPDTLEGVRPRVTPVSF